MAVLAWLWGLLWLGVAALALWPWVDGWLAEAEVAERAIIRWPLTAGLGVGTLTLWLVTVGFWRLNLWAALAFPAAALAGWMLLPRPGGRGARRGTPPTIDLRSLRAAAWSFASALGRGQAAAWILAAGLGALFIVLAQATYYPFIGDDEISRYAYYARLMFVQGRVAAEVRGYPPMMPAAYAYVFLVTGQTAEQLARLIPAMYSAATVMATGALAWRWYGPRGGWAAAFMLIATPLYLQWSPNGYVDIPSALYFVCAAYAADVWLARRRARWAVVAGALVGLALWTKQAGFAALACLGAAFAWAAARDWARGARSASRQALRDGMLALAGALIFGGWWYLRNAYYDGWPGAVPGPGTFYYDLADPGLANAIPFLADVRTFGLAASPLYVAGLVWGLTRIRQAAWPLLWSLPYTLLWWWRFSYDPRFLLTVLPFYAAIAGGMVAAIRWRPGRPGRWALAGLVVLAAALAAFDSRLGGLRQWILAPGATYAERLTRAKGDMYPTVEFLRDRVPASARVVSMDGRLQYYFVERSMRVSYPTRLSELEEFDYFVVGSWWSSAYAGFGQPDNEVVRALDDPRKLERIYAGPSNSLAVYRIIKP